MAKVNVEPKGRKTNDSPTSLTMNLFGPGMSLVHRAGLGGLACTLRYIEKAYANDGLDQNEAPGGPWQEGKPPWSVTPTSITLEFGNADDAGTYLQQLFKIAFRTTKDGLIFLPGQSDYGSIPSPAVLAELQRGLLLTFLQHGKTRKLETNAVTIQLEIDGQTMPPIEYRKCSWYKHQGGWKDLTDNGKLKRKPVEVVGPLNPGAVVRHVAFTAGTRIEEPTGRVLPLYFAIIGCLAQSVNRGMGVLLVPEVTDLLAFGAVRPLMTPTTPADCRITSAGDAALQAHIRVRAKGAMLRYKDLPGIYAMTFRPAAWDTKQKYRVATMHVPQGEERWLVRFEIALLELPPRVKTSVKREAAGRGKQKQTIERTERFWTDSVVRPVIADNLAAGKPWYAGFTKLMTAIDHNNRPVRDRLGFERKGLYSMIQARRMFDDEGEALIVKSIHEAIRQSLGRIREQTDGGRPGALSQATKNRWERFREKLRLDLAGAKTEAQVRFALMDLFSRGGSNSVLRQSWEAIFPVLRRDWALARDLGLLALASYAGRGEEAAEAVNVTAT